MKNPLYKVRVYLTAEEYAPFKALAEDEGVTISAVLRAKLGLDYKRRGAAVGNTNRQANARTRVGKKRGKPRRD